MTMDANRFDWISKSLATAGTRRGLLRFLAASPLAGSLAVVRTEESRGKKRHCKRCMTTSDCNTKPNQICDNGCCRTCTCIGGDCPHASVQAAIDAAKRGATIPICPGIYNERLVIDKNLTLVGAGSGADPTANTILDGPTQSGSEPVPGGVMFVTGSSKLVARSLRFTGGGGELIGFGGGIFTESTTTTKLEHCEVTENSAANHGGGIYNGGTMALINTNVTDNTAISAGGGIYNYATLTLKENSGVTGNHAQFGPGGGIYNNTDATVNAFTPSTVNSNFVGSTPDDCAGDGTYAADSDSVCATGP
jgi:hypothetical protein